MAQTEETEHHDIDEITVNWTIPSFNTLYDSAKTNDKFLFKKRFTLGGQRWAFVLIPEGEEGGVNVYMFFFGTVSASAEYTVYLKSSEGKFIDTLSTGLEQYAPREPNGLASGYNWKSLSELQKEGFLGDGSLHLRLVVSLYSRKVQMKMKLSKDFKKGLDLDSSVGSDVTFIFPEEEGSQRAEKIKAHKAILSLRSSVFATMFASGMKEALEGEVEIEDISPKAFRILLQYIYSGEMDSEWGSVADELFYGVEKYDLEDLGDFLCENVESVLTVKNVMNIRNFAKLKELKDILESTEKFIHNNTKEFLENHDVVFKK